MNQKFNKTDIKNMTRERLNEGRMAGCMRQFSMLYTKPIVDRVIDTFLDIIAEIIEDGDTVNLYGYLKITPVLRKERKRIKAHTGEEYMHPPLYSAKVSVGEVLKNACRNLTERELGQQTAADENL